MSSRSLILAAHGSMAAADSNQPLFDLAQAIARHDAFDVVTPAFLNGQPEMTNVLDGLPDGAKIPPGDVVIVPVMTSEGYYLKRLPGKFAQNQDADQYRLFMTRVIGVHNSIAWRIGERIARIIDEHRLTTDQTTVAVIGHGTRRNKNSGTSTLQLTQRLRNLMSEEFSGQSFPGLKFETAFLDQDPEAELIAQSIQTPNTIIIPFLISRGPHTTDDVPNAFGLPAGADLQFPLVQHQANGVCVYDSPLALYQGIDELCIELADQELATGVPIDLPAPAVEPSANEPTATHPATADPSESLSQGAIL